MRTIASSIPMKHLHRFALVTLATGSFAFAACTDLPTTLEDGGAGTGNSDNVGAGVPEGGGAAGQGGDPSGNGGNGGEAPQAATYELSIGEPASSIDLRDDVELTLTIAPNGYEGAVALTVSGLPADVGVELSMPSVTLDGATEVEVAVRLSSLSSTVTGAFAFEVTGTVDTGAKSTAGTLTIEPVITIVIPPNLASFSNSTEAFGDYPTLITALPEMSEQNPITVRFLNTDTVAHEIHSDGENGFIHGQGPIAPMSYDMVDRHVSAPGEYNFYPHDLNDPSIAGMITIQ